MFRQKRHISYCLVGVLDFWINSAPLFTDSVGLMVKMWHFYHTVIVQTVTPVPPRWRFVLKQQNIFLMCTVLTHQVSVERVSGKKCELETSVFELLYFTSLDPVDLSCEDAVRSESQTSNPVKTGMFDVLENQQWFLTVKFLWYSFTGKRLLIVRACVLQDMQQAYTSLFFIQPHLLQKITHTFNVKVSNMCQVTSSSEADTKRKWFNLLFVKWPLVYNCSYTYTVIQLYSHTYT